MRHNGQRYKNVGDYGAFSFSTEAKTPARTELCKPLQPQYFITRVSTSFLFH